ncbi:MAG: molybdopterin molybdotransferase MoeA [Syntrophales bacterium]|nr:molybdopterin molybdotransferase MoeA [Syntrophales bacterium]
MLAVGEALQRILGTVRALGAERVFLLEALGRVNTEDITAGRTIPPRDNSAMDGYALRAEDTAGADRENPVVLEITEDIPAGKSPLYPVRRGQAARIMTGGIIPEGADAVLRVEDTESAENRVKIFVPVPKSQDVRFAGEDVRSGHTVIPRGKTIGAPEIGMLAAIGCSMVSVHRRPSVAILATGNELAEIDEEPGPGMIVNSNSYALAAQVLECGARPIILGIARDNRSDLVEKFENAAGADMILSSGGVSVGDYDLVKDIMGELGKMDFWRVAMRPGRPLAFGMLQGKPIFGLPGNPVSSMVSFEQFVRPALRKMMGHKELFRRTVKAELAAEIKKKEDLRYFYRARLRKEGNRVIAAVTGDQGSGILSSMVKADGLIILPESVSTFPAGTVVDVQVLRDF